MGKRWGGSRQGSGRKKEGGLVTTFQGRRSDGLTWIRDNKPEKILTDCPKFWQTYEEFSGKTRKFWISFVNQHWQMLSSGDDGINSILLSLLKFKHDIFACWEAYREWFRHYWWHSSVIPKPFLPLEAVTIAERPWVWWYGAISDFWKITKTEMTPLQIPIDQMTWLKKRGYLTKAEERALRLNKEEGDYQIPGRGVLTSDEQAEVLDHGVKLCEWKDGGSFV